MMLKFIKYHKNILVDFIYSFTAYALPTIVLQFVVQPIIAARTTAEVNGLFVTLFNVVKLMISIFIMPLANLRLLKKHECNDTPALNGFFNYLFAIAVICSVIIGTILNGLYRDSLASISDILLLLFIVLLMGIHDYYMIAFRILLNYKRIVIDNILIVVGYGLGLVLFRVTGLWELIFITGYLFGATYVILNTDLWRTKPTGKGGKEISKQYGDLGASSLLGMTSVYCDRLIIYPILGGFDVSVYNAAAVVSKAISVVSAPLRNVLLSYIVNRNRLEINKRKTLKYIPLFAICFAVIFAIFWAFSVVACKYLYPQYAEVAITYIPIITLAVMIQTLSAIMNIALLRFANTKVQTIISAIKLGVYLISVLLLAVVARTGLRGFCLAILISDCATLCSVLISLRKSIIISE